MSKPFAKLFDTPHGQLLAFREYDSGLDKDMLVLMGAAVGGICPTMRHEYPTEEAADTQFDSIDQEKAERTAAGMHKMVKGLAA